MIRKVIYLLIFIIFISCGSKMNISNGSSSELYEILYENENSGANIQFYEIISEKSEFNALLSNRNLRGKVKENDIETSNFILLNLGEKSTGGFAITVESVIETPKNIEVKVKEISPSPGDLVTMAFTYPLCVVKINSKKPILLK